MPLVNEESTPQSLVGFEPPGSRGPGLSRRRFFGAAGALLAAGLAGDGFAIEPRRVLVSRHDVVLPGLAPRLDGLRVAQVSESARPSPAEDTVRRRRCTGRSHPVRGPPEPSPDGSAAARCFVCWAGNWRGARQPGL